MSFQLKPALNLRMSAPYKVQSRDRGEVHFRDISAWLSCEQFIPTMRQLFAANSDGEFQVVDESGLVVASKKASPRVSGAIV